MLLYKYIFIYFLKKINISYVTHNHDTKSINKNTKKNENKLNKEMDKTKRKIGGTIFKPTNNVKNVLQRRACLPSLCLRVL